MKKRYVILAGILAAAVAAAGCGKKDENTDTDNKDAQVTIAPAKDDSSSGEADAELVDMQKSTDADIKNVMGDKTDTAAKLVLINKTGADVARLYIRPNADDDDWGEDLIQGMFTFTNGDKALYYFDKDAKDAEGNTVTSYDIRISYTDENRSECFFRKIPLQNISQISLLMDGSGDSSIPYATYLSGSSKKETSTLNEVKQRLGLMDSEDSDSEEEEPSEDSSVTPTPAPTAAVTATPAPTQTPEDPTDPDNTDITDAGAAKAESFIGQSLDSLIAACGEPSGSEYENEPETGETGYHYYDTFTVSTAVDENGNEVVAGVY